MPIDYYSFQCLKEALVAIGLFPPVFILAEVLWSSVEAFVYGLPVFHPPVVPSLMTALAWSAIHFVIATSYRDLKWFRHVNYALVAVGLPLALLILQAMGHC